MCEREWGLLKTIIHAPSEFLCFALSTGERACCMCTESSYCSSPLLLRIFACLCVACVCVRTQKWIFFRHSITISAAPISPARPIQFPRSSLRSYWKMPIERKRRGSKMQVEKPLALQDRFLKWENLKLWKNILDRNFTTYSEQKSVIVRSTCCIGYEIYSKTE